MVYNLSLYNNATGPLGILEATNYQSGGLLVVLVVLSISLLSFWILTKNNNPFAVSLSITAFGTLLISLLLRVRVFQSVPLLPDWFLITVILTTAFSIGALYISNR